MKSRNVKRFLAILSACVITITGIPITANATESVNEVIQEEESVEAIDEEVVDDESLPENDENVDSDVSAEGITDKSSEDEKTEEAVSEIKTVSPMKAAAKTAIETVKNVAANNSEGSVSVLSEEGSGTIDVTSPVISGTEIKSDAAKVEYDELSGKNAYIPIESEFTTVVSDDSVLVTAFNPTLSQSYELIKVPGQIGGKNTQYGIEFLSSISDLGKGVIFDSGATLSKSSQNLGITYVRFESGAKATDASNTFKGWCNLECVVGFGEALSECHTLVVFNDTFRGCTSLKSTTLNLCGMTASFYGTFSETLSTVVTTVENGKIDNIRNFMNYGDADFTDSLDSPVRYNRTVNFKNITFPNNKNRPYLYEAFTNMFGDVVFHNCKSEDSDLLNFSGAYKNSIILGYNDAYDTSSSVETLEPGNSLGNINKRSDLNIRIMGAKAYSTASMFEGAQVQNVTLAGLITEDTISVDKMFKDATLAGIKEIESWELGTVTADEMFENTRVYFGPQYYLTRTLIPEIKRLDWSKCTSANKLFNFVYKGNCPIDYSGMNLSSVESMTVSGLQNYDFISAATNPQNYVFEQDKVYKLRAGSALGGKALDPVTVTDGKVSGSDIPSNTHIYTDTATIKITNVKTDHEVSTTVVPGYKLSNYLDSSISYYQDRSLTQAVVGDLDVNSGDTVSVYCMLVDEVNRELMSGCEVDFGEDDVEITLEDGTKDKLQDGNADVTIKVESTVGNVSDIKIPTSAKNFSKYSFFNIDLVAEVGGVEKKVTELSSMATIVLPLPNDYESGRIAILNYHDGTNKDPIVLSTTVDKTARTVTFETDKFSPYVILYDESEVKEEVTVTIDLTKVSDSDYSEYLNRLQNSSGKQSMILKWAYDDNSRGQDIFEFEPVSGKRVYTVKAEVIKKTASGKTFNRYTELSFNGDALTTGYDSASDLNTFTVTRIPKASDSKETTTYNFVVKIVDNSNAGNTRPERLLIEFTARYGDYIRSEHVEVNLKNNTGNSVNGNVVFPTTVGGVSMSSLDATTSTATNIGYSSTWDNNAKLFKYVLAGASDTDPNPTVTIDPVDVLITFVGDPATARPNKVTVTLADSNNQNAVTKEISTGFAPSINSYKESFNRLVNDTYHVTGVSGIDATKYKVEYSGLNITATYTAATVTTPNYKRTVTINMDDSNNEDGLRPKSMKVTIANKDGSDSVSTDLTVGDANSFTFDVEVKNANDEYTVKSVSGLPESYTITISGLTVTCKHTVEKITKTYKVEWTGDGDNADKTRPTTVQLTIKNSGTTVQTATVSADTNWTANVSLNKLIKGVEASYTVEGADVSNYSKSVSGDTVTYKFTGTLSKDAAAIEEGKSNGTSATSLDGESVEPTYDIANFDWIDYANRYPDLKKAYGYNKEALYAHYIRYGIGEGRIATFTGKYATVNEDILKAYFPEDYKYKTDLSTVNEEYLIGADKTSATTSGNKVTVDSNGNIHTTVKNPDGTVTETVTDAEGNIISVSTYKTGDVRLEDMSTWFIVLGVLLLAVAAMIVRVVIKDDKKKKAILSLIS